MTLLRPLLLALLFALAVPGAAVAADRFVVRDEPVGVRAVSAQPAARRAPLTFDLVGLHWRGSGRVFFRTRSLTGRWSPWRDGAPESEDLPDPGSTEAALRRGWKFGSPYWTGPADSIQYRTAGSGYPPRAYFLLSGAGARAAPPPPPPAAPAAPPRLLP